MGMRATAEAAIRIRDDILASDVTCEIADTLRHQLRGSMNSAPLATLELR